MALLYPPILENKLQSFPATLGLSLLFEMSPLNDTSKINHAQVLIRYQSSNGAAVASDATPDKATLFFAKTDSPKADDGSYFGPYNGSSSLWEIRVPQTMFDGGPQGTRTYTIQIRFGSAPLWQQDNTMITVPSSSKKYGWKNFAAWRASQVAASAFGEWSNTTTIYCYERALVNSSVDFSDFIPSVVFDCETDELDPLAQGTVRYTYSDVYGVATSVKQIFSSQYNPETKHYAITAKIPIAPVIPVSVSFEGVTKNNTIVGTVYKMGSLFNGITTNWCNTTMYQAHSIAEISDVNLSADEMDDGVIVKALALKSGAKLDTDDTPSFDEGTINVYRMNIYSYETIKIASVNAYGAAKVSFKDYLVEMGEEYIYIFCLTQPNANNNTYKIYVFTNLAQLNDLNPAYGRLMKMDSVFLTTKDHQLRLTGGVNVTSLKRNTSDQFQTTIGSKYPFYSRHSEINYRTFSLTGLVSINFDPTGTFFRRGAQDNCLYWDAADRSEMVILEKDLYGTVQSSMTRRRMREKGHPKQYDTIMQMGENNIPSGVSEWGPQTNYDNYLHRSIQRNVGDSRSDELIYMERKFRDYVMNWLSDGKPKIFRSETEGNMIVMLSGVSFTPNDKSGRMVYSMTATVTEIADYTVDSLQEYDLIPTQITAQLSAGFIPRLYDGAQVKLEDYRTLIYYFPEYDWDNKCLLFKPNRMDKDNKVFNGTAYLTVQVTPNSENYSKDIVILNDFIDQLNSYNFIRGDEDPYVDNGIRWIKKPSYDLGDLYNGMDIYIDTTETLYYVKDNRQFAWYWDGNTVSSEEMYGLSYDNKTGVISGTFKASGVTDGSSGTIICRVTDKIDDGTGKPQTRYAYIMLKHGTINPSLQIGQATYINGTKKGQATTVIANESAGKDPVAYQINTEIEPIKMSVDSGHQGVPFKPDTHSPEPYYLWTADKLPRSLEINPYSGVISGTITTSVPNDSAEITCEDAAGQRAKYVLTYPGVGSKMHFAYYAQYDFPSLEIPQATIAEKDALMRDISDGVTGGAVIDHYTYELDFHGANEDLISNIFEIGETTGKIYATFHNIDAIKAYTKAHPPENGYYYEKGTFTVKATDNQGQTAVCEVGYGAIVLPFIFAPKSGNCLIIEGLIDRQGIGIGGQEANMLKAIQVGTRWQLNDDGQSPLSVLDWVSGGLPFFDKDGNPYYEWSAYNLIPDFEVYKGQVIGEAQRPWPDREGEILVKDARGEIRKIKVKIAEIMAKLQNVGQYAFRQGYETQPAMNYKLTIPFTSIVGGISPLYAAYADEDYDLVYNTLGLEIVQTDDSFVIQQHDPLYNDLDQEVLTYPHGRESFNLYFYDETYAKAIANYNKTHSPAKKFVVLTEEDFEKYLLDSSGLVSDLSSHLGMIKITAMPVYADLQWDLPKSLWPAGQAPTEGEEITIPLKGLNVRGGVGPYSITVYSGSLGYLQLYQSEGAEQNPNLFYLKGKVKPGVSIDAYLVLTDSSGGYDANGNPNTEGNQNTLDTPLHLFIPSAKEALTPVFPADTQDFGAASLIANPKTYWEQLQAQNSVLKDVTCTWSNNFQGSIILAASAEDLTFGDKMKDAAEGKIPAVRVVKINDEKQYDKVRFYVWRDGMDWPEDFEQAKGEKFKYTEVVPGVYLDSQTGIIFGNPKYPSAAFNLAPMIAVVNFAENNLPHFYEKATWMFPAVLPPLLRFGAYQVQMPDTIYGQSLTYAFSDLYPDGFVNPKNGQTINGSLTNTGHKGQTWTVTSTKAGGDTPSTFYPWPDEISFDSNSVTVSGILKELTSSIVTVRSDVPANPWTEAQELSITYNFNAARTLLRWEPDWSSIPPTMPKNEGATEFHLTPLPEIRQNATGGVGPYTWTIEVDRSATSSKVLRKITYGFADENGNLANPSNKRVMDTLDDELYLYFSQQDIDSPVYLIITVTDSTGTTISAQVRMPTLIAPLQYTNYKVVIEERHQDQEIEQQHLFDKLNPSGSTGIYRIIDRDNILKPYHVDESTGILSGNSGLISMPKRPIVPTDPSKPVEKIYIYLVAVDPNDPSIIVDEAPIEVEIGQIFGAMQYNGPPIYIPPSKVPMFAGESRPQIELGTIDEIRGNILGGEGVVYELGSLPDPWKKKVTPTDHGIAVDKYTGVISWWTPDKPARQNDTQVTKVILTDAYQSRLEVPVYIMEIISESMKYAGKPEIPPGLVETSGTLDLDPKDEEGNSLWITDRNGECIRWKIIHSSPHWDHDDGVITIDQETGLITYIRPKKAAYDSEITVVVEDYTMKDRAFVKVGNSDYFYREEEQNGEIVKIPDPGFVYKAIEITIPIGNVYGIPITYDGGQEIEEGLVKTEWSYDLAPHVHGNYGTVEYEVVLPAIWSEWGGTATINKDGKLTVRRPDFGHHESTSDAERLKVIIKDVNRCSTDCPNWGALYSSIEVFFNIKDVFNTWQVTYDNVTWTEVDGLTWEQIKYFRKKGAEITVG